ncbi:hypothetical protein CEXT_758531 [Caerostris extrusa]|uniref:Uncharacterized protein n=1 Tax=Caerostris extrusa TaxID=172846 RepID=A0AAV4SW29_CAEEX|nr:hypothetical protein CEXT_758531 [Caerostris extrusa]
MERMLTQWTLNPIEYCYCMYVASRTEQLNAFLVMAAEVDTSSIGGTALYTACYTGYYSYPNFNRLIFYLHNVNNLQASLLGHLVIIKADIILISETSLTLSR